jgi:hypothetical protein
MISHDPSTGEITDGHIRYLTLRADVLMGGAHAMPDGRADEYLRALEESAFRHARDSFEEYRKSGRFHGENFLVGATGVAATLGWGVWTVTDLGSGNHRVTVRNSPFALGYGACRHPVCGPICGVLRAMVLVGYGRSAQVTEVACAAQGAGRECVFDIVSTR